MDQEAEPQVVQAEGGDVVHELLGRAQAPQHGARQRASGKLVDQEAEPQVVQAEAGDVVHERPLDRRTVWRYLRATAPVSAEVTVFTVADRLATRGKNAEPAIEAHLGLAREVLGPALERRSAARAAPLLRGDELARELELPHGPRLGELLAQLEEDRYAGAISTREEALRRARELDGR